jgi:drug/metabolite transporter (DMT)-like permease
VRGLARLKADFSLLAAAAIWGTAFVAQKSATAHLGPLLFVGCRFLLSALLLAPLAWIEARGPAQILAPGDRRLSVAIGLCLFATMALQQIGMETTTATNAGFLTAIYVAIVPLVAWQVTGAMPRLTVAVACALSLAGAWLLERNGTAHGWNSGDLWVLLSDLFSALQIVLVGIFLGRSNRPFLLCVTQYALTAALGLAFGLWREPVAPTALGAALPAILYAGLLSGGVAFTLQIVAQRHTPAAEAALIMSLESVFAALAGMLVLGDHLRITGFAGCALILLGVLLVQVVPPRRRIDLEPGRVAPQDTLPDVDAG